SETLPSEPQPPPLQLIGRSKELGDLARRLGLSAEGECHLVLVSGPAGGGKRALVDAFERFALARRPRAPRGRFAESEQSFPYDGFFDALREHLRSRPEAAGELTDLAGELLLLFPMLRDMESLRGAATDSTAPERGELASQAVVFDL